MHQQLAALDLQQHSHVVRLAPCQCFLQRVDFKRRFQLGDCVIADMTVQRRALLQRHIVKNHSLMIARELHIYLDVIHAHTQHFGKVSRCVFACSGRVPAMTANPQTVFFPTMNGFKDIHAYFSKAMLTPLSVSKML